VPFLMIFCWNDEDRWQVLNDYSFVQKQPLVWTWSYIILLTWSVTKCPLYPPQNNLLAGKNWTYSKSNTHDQRIKHT
jgi:hypothetical protein